MNHLIAVLIPSLGLGLIVLAMANAGKISKMVPAKWVIWLDNWIKRPASWSYWLAMWLVCVAMIVLFEMIYILGGL